MQPQGTENLNTVPPKNGLPWGMMQMRPSSPELATIALESSRLAGSKKIHQSFTIAA